MLALALVSAAVASGTALTKPVENPLRRLSESDPTGGACSAEAVAGIASDPPTFGVSAICSTSTCVPWLVTYVEANIATVEGAIAMYGTGTAYDDMLVELEATLTQVQSLSAVCAVEAGCGDTFFAIFLTDMANVTGTATDTTKCAPHARAIIPRNSLRRRAPAQPPRPPRSAGTMPSSTTSRPSARRRRASRRWT